jgi:hypothetical protein
MIDPIRFAACAALAFLHVFVELLSTRVKRLTAHQSPIALA